MAVEASQENSTPLRRRKSLTLGSDLRTDKASPSQTTTKNPSPSRKKSLNRRRKRPQSLTAYYVSLSLQHTWSIFLAICLLILALYLLNPSPSNPLHAFLFLSYALPPEDQQPTLYGKGPKDLAFIAYYAVLLSFARSLLMQHVLRPLSIYFGVTSASKQSRIMEQAYNALYYLFIGPLGIYIIYDSDLWYFSTEAMYEGYPHLVHTGLFKAYYLVQASFWTQQALVLLLGLERRRKDFYELVAHHIVTVSLIALSYRFHFMKMGVLVFVTHDVSDFFLSITIILNKLSSPLVPPSFFLFFTTWTYLRHYQNMRILLSFLPLYIPSFIANLLPSFPSSSILSSHPKGQFSTLGPFVLDWAAQEYKCPLSQWIAFSLLALLQGLNVYWLVLVMRTLGRMVRSGGRERVDERSDDEEEK